MLVYLDLLIGFAVVMLGVSLLTMILTQMVAAVLRLRTADLHQGVERLLRNADPALERHAREVTEAVLGHELVSDSLVGRRASTIRKEELRRLLDTVADPDGSGWQKELAAKLDAAKESVTTWFDSVMDRSSQRFAAKTRLATAAFALLFAFALHLDAGELLVRLGSDAELRAKLVAGSDAVTRQAERLTAREAEADSSEELEALQEETHELRTSLTEMGIDLRPDYLRRTDDASGTAASGCRSFLDGLKPWKLHFWGILASAALLGLGAPFWFNSLKVLSSLRPIVARKEDRERERR